MVEPVLFVTFVVSFVVTVLTLPHWIRRAKKAGLKGGDMNKYKDTDVAEAGGIVPVVGFLIGALIFFYILWQETLRNEQKLREEKLIFQYETIKNQVNPHFLFNSLNTLSSLINGNTRAEDFIHKLSSIYRYILENRNVDQVGLEEEIEFAKNYFFLQKIRDEEKITLEIKPFDMKKFMILPISLQLLIENALKHNSATRDYPLTITIYKEDDLIVVKNNLQKKLNIEESPGTGLRNLGERLKLITNREMKVIETSDEFIVKIPLIIT